MLLAQLLAGHLLGDWVVQTDWQAAHKTERSIVGWKANFTHVLTYSMTLDICLFGSDISGWALFVILVVSAITHAFIDRRWPVRWLLEHTGSKAFAALPWGVMATDQALHLSVLCLLAAAFT